MGIFDGFKSAVLAGLGVMEKGKEFIDELVMKGEASESEGAKIVKDISEKAEKGSDDFTKSISDLVTKTLEKMNLPTRDDIASLDRRVKTLNTKIRKLEGAQEKPEQKDS